jgi:hypothetical protein
MIDRSKQTFDASEERVDPERWSIKWEFLRFFLEPLMKDVAKATSKEQSAKR